MASKVTIQQLLTHTGGTGDFFGPEFDKHRLELKTLQDYVKLYDKRPAFELGSRFEYSNYGFGFFDTSEAGLECFRHGGGAPGMNGDLKSCPKSGYVIVVLANLDPPAAQRISSFAANRLPLN